MRISSRLYEYSVYRVGFTYRKKQTVRIESLSSRQRFLKDLFEIIMSYAILKDVNRHDVILDSMEANTIDEEEEMDNRCVVV